MVCSDFQPQRLVVDPRVGFVFYTETTTSAIYRLNTDGSEHSLFLTTAQTPFALANDYERGWLFYGVSGVDGGEVWRVSVSDSSLATLITDDVMQPNALAYLQAGACRCTQYR